MCAQITSVLGVDSHHFGPATRYRLPTLSEGGVLVRDGRAVDVARRGLPTDTEVALPARAGGLIRGHFLLIASTRVVRPSRSQLRVAVTLANQVGAALAGSTPADVPSAPRPGTG